MSAHPVPRPSLPELAFSARLPRRDVMKLALRVSLALALGPASLASASGATSPLSPLQLSTLKAFLDTLIPADALSPSASQAGVLKDLLAESRHDSAYQKLLRLGCDWIALQTAGDFAVSSPEARAYVVDWMAKAGQDTLARRFFDVLWDSSLTLYYTRRAAWSGSSFSAPPQPVGYPEITHVTS